MSTIAVDGDRLWQSLDEISQFGATPAGGLHRLAASPEDGLARDYFVSIAKSIGCTVRVDQLGNTFVRRQGADSARKAILIGSHLDSQPFGGKYDGIYGVMAGLEVLRTLHAHQVELDYSVEVACWTNEEGARFAPAMMGAAYFATKFQAHELLQRLDIQGISLEHSLREIGYLGSDHVTPDEFETYLEIHIEQGPVLENSGTAIGVVTGVQAMQWHRVMITGQSGHAGTYPMEIRQDALVAASEVVAQVEQIGLRHPQIGRATVGFLEVHPNSPNVIPGSVELMVEFRHPDQNTINQMSSELETALAHIHTTRNVQIAKVQELDAAPVVFDASLVDTIEKVCQHHGISHQRMLSGAGHDAVQVSSRIPSAMIFIPCVKGISHAQDEEITSEWAKSGAQVLLDTVLSLNEKTSQ